MRLTTRAWQVPRPPPMKLKQGIIKSYPTPKVYAKASKRSVVSMAYRPNSKVIATLKSFWFPPKDKDLMENKSKAMY